MTSWGSSISHFQAPDLHPITPRITARAGHKFHLEHKQYVTPRWYRRMMLSVVFQAAQDYQWAKALQKRHGAKTEEDVSKMAKWDRETIANGKRAFEWFTTQPAGLSDNRFTYRSICHEFNVDPVKLWRKIKKDRSILESLNAFRHGEAMS